MRQMWESRAEQREQGELKIQSRIFVFDKSGVSRS